MAVAWRAPSTRSRPCAPGRAGIFAIAPVDEIVDAFLAGAGVVEIRRGRQARRGGQLLRQLAETGA